MMEQAVASAVQLLRDGQAACVVLRNGEIVRVELGRGVAPMIRLYEDSALQGAYVADKIVGKAAAMLMTLGGVSGCYALTVSRAALDWFSGHGIPVEYEVCAEYIVNRAGDGMCPMEQTVKDLNDPSEALTALKQKIAELRNRNGGFAQ